MYLVCQGKHFSIRIRKKTLGVKIHEFAYLILINVFKIQDTPIFRKMFSVRLVRYFRYYTKTVPVCDKEIRRPSGKDCLYSKQLLYSRLLITSNSHNWNIPLIRAKFS